MPLAGKSPDLNPCMLFIANIYFLVLALEISVFLQSQIGDKDIQCTVLNVKPSGLSWLFSLSASDDFLSSSLKAPVTRTVINGFPSVTSVLQHLVFKMFFHDVLFTAPSPSPGGDEKSHSYFQRSPVNYSTGLCIAYSLHTPLFYFLKLIFVDYCWS